MAEEFDYVDAGATPHDGSDSVGREVVDLGWLAPHGNQMSVEVGELHARWGPNLLAIPEERAVYDPLVVSLMAMSQRARQPTDTDNVLRHHRYGLRGSCRWVRHDARLIDEFIALKRPERVLPFARRWGLLQP